MSILIDKNTRLVVQGITGREGLFHSEQMLDYFEVKHGVLIEKYLYSILLPSLFRPPEQTPA